MKKLFIVIAAFIAITIFDSAASATVSPEIDKIHHDFESLLKIDLEISDQIIVTSPETIAVATMSLDKSNAELSTTKTKTMVTQNTKLRPLTFTSNMGQWDERALFGACPCQGNL